MARYGRLIISPDRTIVAAILMSVSLLRPAVAAERVEVPRWQPHDFAFVTPVAPDDPFRVVFSADVTGPGGIKLNVPGFYDGGGSWTLRISAAKEGDWSLTTHSNSSQLDHIERTFTCVPNPSRSIHGSLRVDPEHPHQFVFEDGARCLPMGYECDWLWALDANAPDLKTINPFLDKLIASGFNFIILNAYAHDTSWRKGRTGADDFGPPPMYAWEGDNAKPDHSKFNLPFWQHYDRVIDAMYRRGIVAHVLIKVYNKQVNWPANGSAEDDLYFRWLIARYAAYPNVTWDLAKEAHNEKDLDYKITRLKFIRANDPYHRLLTVHDDKANYDRGAYDELVDCRSDQQHSKWHDTMLDHLRQRDWPVINTEFGYECGPGGLKDKTYGQAQDAREVARRAWEVYFSGGFGAYYYTYTAWDVIRPEHTPPGYAHFKRLHDFFDQTAYWRMKPTDDVASEGYCLADAGREYAVFLNEARPFTLKVGGIAAPLNAYWLDPFSDRRESAGTLDNGATEVTPPRAWGNGPVVLHVGEKK